MPVRHAFEDVLKVGEGFDIVELGGGDQGADGRPPVGATVGSGEQMVLAAERDGPDRAFNGVGIEFDRPSLRKPHRAVHRLRA